MGEIELLTKKEDTWQSIDKLLNNLSKGKGSVIAVFGETGMGKTFFLNEINNSVNRKSSFTNLMVDCQSPIGSFKVGKLQPMLPFARAIEALMSNQQGTAEKKFAVNVGMTVLASIPLAGDLFYAVKELGRDWRQFKKDKGISDTWKVSQITQDYFDAILSFANKKPLVLIMDDMHFSDAQSIELLRLFTEEIENLPIMIIFSYKQSSLESTVSPLLTYLQNFSGTEKFHQIEMTPFEKSHIRDITRKYFSKYKIDEDFENWLLEHSFGVPGVVVEYLKYFKKNSPFNDDGSLKSGFEAEEYLPSTIHSAFSQILEKMSEDDKNILALCSAEGKEFTALIAADLMNTDILTAIKKLRKIQHETGIISSKGPNRRYGVKTTLYRFTQQFYHNFFENSLEYEEHLALHGQIAGILKQKFNEAGNDAIREEIAPYLAAHSSESGDEETTKKMLLVSAKAAQKTGSTEVIKNAYEDYKQMMSTFGEMEENDLSPQNIAFRNLMEHVDSQNLPAVDGESDTIDNQEVFGEFTFESIRNSIVLDYHSKKYDLAAEKAITYLNSNEKGLDAISKVQLIMLAVKSYIEIGDIHSAKSYAANAEKISSAERSNLIDCLVFNMLGVLAAAESRQEFALQHLQDAAKKAINLPSEMRLLTLSNIGLLLKSSNPDQAEKYFTAADKLSKRLRYREFIKDVHGRAFQNND
jgi:predicted ATPase